jgi:tetraacyldisaccharide 4'-kinase
MILVTRCPERLKPIERREIVKSMQLTMGQHLYFTTIRYGNLVPVFDGVPDRNTSWYRERASGILIVTGISQPRAIRKFARSINTHIREMTFPDHHRYSEKDLARIVDTYRKMISGGNQVLILTTEKDAARLRELPMDEEIKEAFRAVRIHIHFLNEDKDNFDLQIKNYVRNNKRSSILYQGKD